MGVNKVSMYFSKLEFNLITKKLKPNHAAACGKKFLTPKVVKYSFSNEVLSYQFIKVIQDSYYQGLSLSNIKY